MRKFDGSLVARLGMMAIAMIGAGLLAVGGCATNSAPDDPTTRALGDPMNYSPPDNYDITGGDMNKFNKDAFGKDVDHVLNP